METYGRFLFEFLNQFFSGFGEIFGGLWKGIVNIFNIPEYYYIIQQYANDFKMSEWLLTGIAIICMLIVIGAIIGILTFFLKKHMKWRKKIINQEELLKQIDTLNDEVEGLVDEKMKLLSMKAPELGLNPGLNTTTSTRNITTTGGGAVGVGIATGATGSAVGGSARVVGGGVGFGGRRRCWRSFWRRQQ